MFYGLGEMEETGHYVEEISSSCFVVFWKHKMGEDEIFLGDF